MSYFYIATRRRRNRNEVDRRLKNYSRASLYRNSNVFVRALRGDGAGRAENVFNGTIRSPVQHGDSDETSPETNPCTSRRCEKFTRDKTRVSHERHVLSSSAILPVAVFARTHDTLRSPCTRARTEKRKRFARGRRSRRDERDPHVSPSFTAPNHVVK